jgi:serine/threonine-protein kinase
VTTKHQLGKYRLIAELGHGGMADVYLSLVEGPVGSGFSKLAVVKRLRANLAEDPEFVAMLVDEARITARLNHPNVVQMLEVGVVDDEYFLAMEYLDGQPLHRLERRASRSGVEIPRDMHLAVLADVLSGLHHAHELADYDGSPLNVVHRDVTPQNIFITYDGQVKVMDFGIAKAAGRAQETMQGIVKGKVRYMSPEQAMGQPLDRRADLFAVGVMIWQAATGKRFWADLDELAIVQALIGGEFQPSPRAVSSDVPEELDRICRRALARHADDRYASALDLRADLESFLGAAALNGRRELSAMLNELFAKERRELRSIVEKVGRESTSATPSMAVLAKRGLASSTSTSLAAFAHSVPPAQDARIVTVTSAPPPPRVPSSVPSPAGRGARVLFAGAIGLAAFGVAALAFVSGRMGTGPARLAAPAVVVDDHVGFAASPYRTRYVAPSAAPVAWHPAWTAPPAPAPAPPPATPLPAPSHTAAPLPPPPSTGLPVVRGHAPRLSVDSADPWTSRSPR